MFLLGSLKKSVVDFLLVLIELVLLGVTAENATSERGLRLCVPMLRVTIELDAMSPYQLCKPWLCLLRSMKLELCSRICPVMIKILTWYKSIDDNISYLADGMSQVLLATALRS